MKAAAPDKAAPERVHRAEETRVEPKRAAEVADPDPIAIRAALGAGSPLDPTVRTRAGRAYAADLSHVRVHTDAHAGQLATDLHARAFTVGEHVAFAPAQYRPGTLAGDALLAHELAHVVQQRGAISPGAPTRAHEADATRAAVAAAHGIGARPSLRTGLALQRCGFLFDDGEVHGHEVLAPAPAAVTFPADDMPGRLATFERRGGWTEAPFDSDGDTFRDSVVRFQVVDTYARGGPRTVAIQLARRADAAHRADARFTLPEDVTAFSLIPRFRATTDGRDPTVVLLNMADTEARISAPVRSPGGDDVYTVEVAGQRLTLTLPTLVTVRPVFAPDAPVAAGGATAIDTTIGPFNDRFRLTFQRDASRPDGATLGVSVLSGGRSYWGESVPLTVTGTLSPRVLSGSGIRLLIDLNGDGAADLDLADRITEASEPSRTGFVTAGPPTERRDHLIVIQGSAVGSAVARFHIEGGQVHAGYSGPGGFEAASAATGITYLAREAVSGTALEDVQRLDQTLSVERQRAVDAGLIGRPLFDAWMQASVDVIQIGLALQGNPPTVDSTLQSRTATDVGTFFDALSTETAHEFQPQTSVFPGMGPSAGSTTWTNPYTGEAQGSTGISTVTIRPWRDELVAAVRGGRWDQALVRYREVLAGLDRWIASKRRAADPELAQRIEYMTTLATELQRISPAGRNVKRIVAVFHPEDESITRAEIVDVPLPMYYWDDGTSWHVVSLANPARPFEPDPVTKAPGETDPPESIFSGLDNRFHLPRGFIRYQIPGGRGGSVRITSSWTFTDYAAAVGLGLAAIGLTLATAGAAGSTVAVVGAYVLAASAVVGAVGAGVDLYERYRANALDEVSVTLDLLQIAGGFAGATQIVAGRLVVNAVEAANAGRAWTGLAARFAAGADVVYLPAAVTAVTADTATVLIVSGQTVDQIRQINGSATLDDAQKRRAIALLLGNLAFMGGMTALAIRGTIPDLRRGPAIRIEFADVQVAATVPRGGARGTGGAAVEPPVRRVAIALPAISEAGAALRAGRPTLGAATTAQEWEAASAAYLQTVRARVAGAAGERLAQIEEQALRMAWRFEETRRITSAVLEAASAHGSQPLRTDLTRRAGRIAAIMNDPALTPTARRTQVQTELAAMDAAAAAEPAVHNAVDWGAARSAAASVSAPTSAGVYVRDSAGNLTRGGQPAGTLGSLLEQVSQANALNFANGVDIEYLVIVREATTAGGQAEVQIVSRPRQILAPAVGTPQTQLPSLREGATGRYVVDIGAGGAAYATDMTPQSDRAVGTLVQTEVPDFATAAQVRRDLTLANIAPRSDPGSVTVLADALRNLTVVFGRPAAGRGVRRLFINNINARYQPADYDQLAGELINVMGRGGQVEVQWDMSPELPNAAAGDRRRLPGSRDHIRGDLLRDALRRRGAQIGYTESTGVPYPYTITPSRTAGGTQRAATDIPPPPNPADPATGHRAVLVFQ
jgi:Domain of unknown function (DUF4157)